MSDETIKPVILLAFANDRTGKQAFLQELNRERRQLDEIISNDPQRLGLCDLAVLPDATPNDVREKFLATNLIDRIAILHFAGHSGRDVLLFESVDGGTASLRGDDLALFLGLQRGLVLVFLNGCGTQGHVERLLDAGVKSVIATSRRIADTLATEFAVSFYKRLAQGDTIPAAFAQAKAGIPLAQASGSSRGFVYADEVGEETFPERDPKSQGREPPSFEAWDLKTKPGAEDEIARWTLADAADNPLALLPELPSTIGLPRYPYQQLNSFGSSEARVFFGRGHDIAKLYRQLQESNDKGWVEPVFLLYGKTGVGKSSFLEAGLYPRLHGITHTVIKERRPQAGLLRDLIAQLGGGASLAEAWRENETEFNLPVLLVVDQVDEYFTQGADRLKEFEKLLNAVEPLFHARLNYPKGKLVLGFREEWLADVKDMLNQRSFPRTEVRLGGLDRRGIIEAIEGIWQNPKLRDKYQLALEEEKPHALATIMADKLVEDREAPVAPTLQLLLSDMYEQADRRTEDQWRVFNLGLFTRLWRGDLMEHFFDERLVEIGETQAPTIDSGLALDVLHRHTTDRGEAAQCGLDELKQEYSHCQAELTEFLRQATEAYLLIPAAAAKPNSATRLIHDTLAPLIRRRFEQSDKDGQRARRMLEARMKEAQLDEHSKPQLLSQSELAIVERGRMGMRIWNADEEKLVGDSSVHWDAEDRAKRRRKRRAWAGVATIAGLSFASFLFAIKAQQEEKNAKEAIDLAITSGDEFLTDVANKLRLTPGVPPSAIDDLHQRGIKFFDQLIAKAGETPKINIAMAKMHQSIAEAAELTGNSRQMIEESKQARERLIHAVGNAPTSFQDAVILAKTYEDEAKGYIEQKEYSKALEAAQTAKTLEEQAINTASSELETVLDLAENDWLQSKILSKQEKYQEALEQATNCLNHLDPQSKSNDSERLLPVRLRCLINAGLAKDSMGSPTAARHYYWRAIGLLDKHPVIGRDMRLSQHRVLNNIGASYINENPQNIGEALKWYESAEKVAEAQYTQMRSDLQTKDHLAFYLHNIGLLHAEHDHRDEGISYFERAYQLRHELAQANPLNKQWQDYQEYSLYQLWLYLQQTDRHNEFKPVAEAYLALKEKQIEQDPSNQETRVDFITAKYWLCENQKNLGDRQSSFACYRQTITLTEQYSKENDKEVRFRHYLQYSLINLEPKAKDKLPLDVRIQQLREALALQKQYANAPHKNWMLSEHPIFTTQEALAKALQENGDKGGALQAAKESAEQGGTTAMKLLAQWYETGEGPVTVDKAEAERWKAEAKRRDPNNGFKRFTVPVTLSYSASDKTPWKVFLRDPVDGNDPVEEEIDRLEYWEGAIMPEDVKTVFRKLLKIAKDNNVSFEELLVYATDSGRNYAANADDYYVKLSCAYDGINPLPDKYCVVDKGLDSIIKITEETRKREGAESIIKGGIAKAIADANKRIFVRQMAIKSERQKLWQPALWAYDALIAADKTNAIELLPKRGNALEGMGLFQEAEANFFKYLAFKPDDPSALNHLAYLWIEQDRDFKPALELLNRANKLQPDDPFIRDSIGWAYVKLGDIDQALPNLEAAWKIDPKQAEIAYHLGEAHHRAGREDQAKDYWNQALGLNPDAKLKAILEKKLAEQAPISPTQPPQ